jgi:uncharacterized sulfatase
VPLIVVAPGAKGNGKATTMIVQSLDIGPTLYDLCGLTPPEGLEGHSLAPLLDDPSAAWDYPAFSVFGNARSLGVAVRDGRYRYVEYDGGKAGAMLFDHATDPHERTNLVEDPRLAKVRERLSALARKHAAAR